MTDVLIVGAGPAGSSLAIQLGRAGFSVELHDRARFPREKVCGEGLMPAGVAALNRLQVEVKGQHFHGITYIHKGLSATANFQPAPGLPDHGLGVRRLHLDAALARLAAATRGVTLIEGSDIEGPLVESGAVRGVTVGGGARRARLVVAADGVHSRTRKALGLEGPARRERYGVRAHFRLAPGRPGPCRVEILIEGGREYYVTPLPEGEIQVALLAATGPGAAGAGDFERVVREPKGLARWLDGATMVSEVGGVSPLSGTAKARAVPGCVLLGDAAGFIDPITGGGVTQALLSSEMLAGHLKADFNASLEHLIAFDRGREAMLRDYRRVTAMALGLARAGWLTPLSMRALRAWPALFSHLVSVSGGARPLVPGGAR